MNKDKIEVTDELLACYLESKLTAKEKAAVEQYLSEHDDALEAVIQARYGMGFKRERRRFFLYGILLLLLLAVLALIVWRLLTPLQMKVNITEDNAYTIPALPFEGGTLQCDYAGNALQCIALNPDNTTVFLNDIPYRFKGSPVHLVFEAEGYQTELLRSTLRHFEVPEENVSYQLMPGKHCVYVRALEENGDSVFGKLAEEFFRKTEEA